MSGDVYSRNAILPLGIENQKEKSRSLEKVLESGISLPASRNSNNMKNSHLIGKYSKPRGSSGTEFNVIDEEKNYEDSLVVGHEVSFHDPDGKMIAFDEEDDYSEK